MITAILSALALIASPTSWEAQSHSPLWGEGLGRGVEQGTQFGISNQVENEVLGYTKIGGTEVPILAPKYEGEPYVGPFKVGNEPYVLLGNGTVQRLAEADRGRWLKSRYGETQKNLGESQRPILRIGVVVFERCERVVDPRTIFDRESAYLDEREIKVIKQDLAQAEATAEAEARGTVDFQFEFWVESSPIRNVGPSDLVRQRARTSTFESADGSKLLPLHGMIEVVPEGGEAFCSVSSVPCPVSGFEYDFNHSENLLFELKHVVGGRARWLGFEKAFRTFRYDADFWRAFCETSPVSSQDWTARSTQHPMATEKSRSKLNSAPYDPNEAKKANFSCQVDEFRDLVDALPADSRLSNYDFSIHHSSGGNAILNPALGRLELWNAVMGDFEPGAVRTFGTPELDSFFKIVGDRPQFRFMPSWGRTANVAFDGERWQCLLHDIAGKQYALEFFDGQWVTATHEGFGRYSAKLTNTPSKLRYKVMDQPEFDFIKPVIVPWGLNLKAWSSGEVFSKAIETEHGPGLEIQLPGGRPYESLDLSGPCIAHVGQQALEVWVKGNSSLAMEFWSPRSTPLVFNTQRTQYPEAGFANRIRLSPEWQKLVFVRDIAKPEHVLSQLKLHTFAGSPDGYDVYPTTLSIAGLKMRPPTPEESKRVWETSEAGFWQKLTEAEVAQGLAQSSWPVLNAALLRAQELKSPGLVPQLTQLAKSGDYATSLLALNALIAVGGADLEKTLGYCIEMGPFDHNRHAAISLLNDELRPKFIRQLSAAVTSSDWGVRQAAVLELSKVGAGDAVIALLVMMRDPEPTVRSAAASGIHAPNSLAERRLLYAAVNDSYESVRSAAYTSLIKVSATEETLKEAFKGIKDDAFTVRVAVLDAMAAKPSANQRQAIGMSLSDPWPWVRAAAVRALAKQPGEVSEKEVEHLVLDPFPEIRKAMQDLAKAKGLSFAWD